MAQPAHEPALKPLVSALAALALLFCCASEVSAARSNKKAAAKKTFQGQSRVVVVEVPVNIVTKDGEPVRGLTAEDFEVIDEGTQREIKSFEVFDLDLNSQDEEMTRQEIDRMPSSARRHFLLLFDLTFSSPTAILRARLAARDFVQENLHPADLVSVATFSLETGMRMLVTFTPDRGQVARAIDTLGAVRQADKLDPLRFIIETPNRVAQEASSSVGALPQVFDETGQADPATAARAIILEQMDRSQKSFERSRIVRFSRTLGEMARMLGTIQGRKHVVFFSEGFDSSLMVGEEVDATAPGGDQRAQNISFGNLWSVDTDDMYGNTRLQNVLGTMVREFLRADCVLQAVDIGGLRAENAASEGAGTLNSGQEGLFYIANETGGELFKDANNLQGQLERVLSRSTVTYVLAFEPDDLSFDGSFHRLKVKLKDKSIPRSARMSHRMGYYEPRPFAELHPLEKSLLASSSIASPEEASELEMDVLVTAFRAGSEASYVPVILELEGESLLVENEQPNLNVELYAYVTDNYGEMRDFFTQRIALDLNRGGTRQKLLDTGIKYYGHLELAPGEYLIRVLARNSVTGRTAVRAVPLTVPAYTEQEAVVLPPFFLDDPQDWLLVRERLDATQGDSVVYPFVVNGQPYIPAVKPQFDRSETASFCLVGYNLGSEPDMVGQVISSEGQPVDGGRLKLVERTITGIEGYDKLLANFKASGLEKGEYELEVKVTDPSTGRSLVNSIPFTVLK